MTKTHVGILRVMTFIVGIAVILSMTYIYALFNPVQGAALETVSDTLTTSGTLGPSAPSVAASHFIVFTLPPSTTIDYDGVGADTFTIFWDDDVFGGNPSAGGNEFSGFGTVTLGDIDVCIGEEGAACGADLSMASDGCSVGTEDLDVTINDPGDDIVFEICSEGGAGTVDADDVIEIQIGSAASGGVDRIINPAGADVSYPITIHFDEDGAGGAIEDQGEARVMILDQVTVTAQTATSLTCYVSGLAETVDVNGVNTDTDGGAMGPANDIGTAASATLLDFGFIYPIDGMDITDREVAGQELEVGTNARNGFLWTIEQDQNITASTGDDLDLFIDAGATATPTDWVSPAGTVNLPDTFGHYGITTADSNLETDTGSSADDFDEATQAACTGGSDPCIAGNIATARPIFANDGPADGDGAGGGTADRGLTQWALLLEISSLQEAAEDYTNTLTHICTPTF